MVDILNIKGDISITVHRYPDGDACASIYAIHRLLKRHAPNAKAIRVVCDYPNTEFERLKTIDEDIEIIETKELKKGSHLIILDHNKQEVSLCTDGDNPLFKSKTIIDHHFYSKELDLKDITKCIDPSYASTCELIFDKIEEHCKKDPSIKIEPEIYAYLYMGMTADTQGLRVGFSKKRVRKLVQLLDKGADEFVPDKGFAINKWFALHVERCIGMLMSKAFEGKCGVVVTRIEYSNYKRFIKATRSRNVYLAFKERIGNISKVKTIIVRYEPLPDSGSLDFETTNANLVRFLREEKDGVISSANGGSVHKLDESEVHQVYEKLKYDVKEFFKKNPDEAAAFTNPPN